VPGRFDRFAKNVLGEDAGDDAKKALRDQLAGVWNGFFNVVRKLDQGIADASVDEGYGRLDALNRIGNQVLGSTWAKRVRKRTIAPTNAPVNFPHIWNASWFDLGAIQCSIEQPMVRNAGEALGVSAPVDLTDASKGLFKIGRFKSQLSTK